MAEFSHAAEDVEWVVKLAPGVYAHMDTETLHLNVPELLEANGYENTPENVERIVTAARSLFARMEIPMVEET